MCPMIVQVIDITGIKDKSIQKSYQLPFDSTICLIPRYSSPPPPESNVRFRTRLSEPISVPTPPDNLIKYKRKKESLPGKVFH